MAILVLSAQAKLLPAEIPRKPWLDPQLYMLQGSHIAPHDIRSTVRTKPAYICIRYTTLYGALRLWKRPRIARNTSRHS